MAKTMQIIDTIGNTPLVKLNSLATDNGTIILAKQESRNPMGSVKDRIALAMIEAAEQTGVITPDITIVEPTSGNTGIGLAMVCGAKKLKLVLTMPESMSLERRKLLTHLGAKLVLTPAADGMKGAIRTAEDLVSDTPGTFMPNQFGNPANPAVHRSTTGPEIWEATAGKIDIFVAGVGTGGTITGVGEYLKQKNKSIQIVAVEPADSPVLSGGSPGPHKIQGIGAGFIPDILNRSIIDSVIQVDNEAAMEMSRQLAKEDGILCGISSGAAAWAARQLAEQEATDYNIVTILPDTGERYLSTELIVM